MRLALLILLATAAVGYAKEPDAIDRLVAKLSTPDWKHSTLSLGGSSNAASVNSVGEPWMNGSFPGIGLPETASPEEVVKKVYEADPGKRDARGIKILKIRSVYIEGLPRSLCTAALVQTHFGEEVVLLQWWGSMWWSHVFY